MVQYQDVHLCRELHQNSQQILEIRCKIYSDYYDESFSSNGMYKNKKIKNSKQIINALPDIVEKPSSHINSQ